MNQLPQIFRQTHQPSGIYKQGRFFDLRLNQSFNKNISMSLDKSSAKMRTRLKVNRYSVEKSQLQTKRFMGYSTISYDHLNDPEFYGAKGKKDHIESYNVLLQQRKKAIEIVGLKVSSLNGFKEHFSDQLFKLKGKYMNDLKKIQTQCKQQMNNLKRTMSQLRRQTGQQLKLMKGDLKDFNEELIIFCQQFKKIEVNYQKCWNSLQPNN